MHKAEFLEWALARFTERERATAILGDLLETAQTKGRAWFWMAFARVLARLAWRGPAAWVAGYAMGAILFERLTIGDVASHTVYLSVGEPMGSLPAAQLPVALSVIFLSFPLWFVAPYGVMRFGPRDEMSRLVVPLCAVATLGLWLGHLHAVGVGNATAMWTGIMACAAVIVGIVLTAFLLRQWRALIALTSVVCVSTGVLFGGAMDWFEMLATHCDWGYRLRWARMEVGCLIMFGIVTAVYSIMHRLLGSRLRTFLGTTCLVSASGIAMAAYGPNSPSPTFVAADVHASAFSAKPEFRQLIHGDRWILRDATMLNLVSNAYKVEARSVVGGPSWLEWNRFDVVADVAPGIDPRDRTNMLQSLLKERFKLVTHSEDRPQPAFALVVAKGGAKLKKGDPSVPQKCESSQTAATDAVPYVVVHCVSQTPELLVRDMRGMAGGYVTAPVVDQTGLKGVWDFEIKWTARNQLAKAGADGISFFDALQHQLGLQLTPTTTPLPVLVVDSVSETPTPNAPDLAKVMPPLPPAEFEVATIRPSKADTQEDGDINGLEINLQGVTLQALITEAWDVPDDGSTMVGAPKWMNTDKFDIRAKAAVNGPPTGAPPEFDEDDLREMLWTFLAERFKLATHVVYQPMEAYNLVAVNPKMQKSDPTVRTGCKSGPGPDGKDPRIANPILNRLISCQNITMTQFAEYVQTMAPGYIKSPVADMTGLAGGWNFTLSYSGIKRVNGTIGSAPAGGDATAGEAAEPNSAISLIDALPRETGLKLEKVRRPVQVLVIDHVDEKPTEN